MFVLYFLIRGKFGKGNQHIKKCNLFVNKRVNYCPLNQTNHVFLQVLIFKTYAHKILISYQILSYPSLFFVVINNEM